MKKFVALLLCVTLLDTPGLSLAGSDSKSSSIPAKSFDFSILSQSLDLTTQSPGFAWNKPYILIMRDLHADGEAQFKISKGIEKIASTMGHALVLEEGAVGRIDTGFFGTFPDQTVKEEVTRQFMDQGWIRGPEYLSITKYGKIDLDLHGVEKKELYERNFEQYREVLRDQAQSQSALTDVKRELRKIKEKVYSPELLRLEDEKEKYDQGKSKLDQYIGILFELADSGNFILKSEDNPYPQLALFNELTDKRKHVAEAEALKERDQLMKLFSEKLDTQALSQWVKTALEYRLGRISSKEYFLCLQGTAEKLGKRMDADYPALNQAILLADLESKIDGLKLMQEIEGLENALLNQWAKNDEEKKISDLWKRLGMVQKMLSLQLTSSEWQEYEAHSDLYRMSEILKSAGVKENSLKDLDLDETFAKAQAFYKTAKMRDEVLAANAVDLMNAHKEAHKNQVAFLVVGGFHTQGIEKILQSRGIGYVELTPKVNHEPNASLYLSRMMDERFKMGTIPVPCLFDEMMSDLLTLVKAGEWEEMAGAYVQALQKKMTQGNAKDPESAKQEMRAKLERWKAGRPGLNALEQNLFHFIFREMSPQTRPSEGLTRDDIQKFITDKKYKEAHAITVLKILEAFYPDQTALIEDAKDLYQERWGRAKIRRRVFIHQDGMAMAPVLTALKKMGVLDLFKDDRLVSMGEIIRAAKGSPGYLHVAMRLFVSQGWMTRTGQPGTDDLTYTLTEDGTYVLSRLDYYGPAAEFVDQAIRMDDYLFSESRGPPADASKKSYAELIQLSKNQWNIPSETDPQKKALRERMIQQLDGLLAGPTMVALAMRKVFDDFDKKTFSFDIRKISGNADHLSDAFQLLEQQGWVKRDGSIVTLTREGRSAVSLAAGYGVTTSYLPTFAKLPELLAGQSRKTLFPVVDNKETHVNRPMNVWGSGGSHKSYFEKLDQIILDIFNRPLEEQPHGIADMGCGNGAFLQHLYKVVMTQTKRGEKLREIIAKIEAFEKGPHAGETAGRDFEEYQRQRAEYEKYKLVIVGADFNEEARHVTEKNLREAGVRDAQVIFGDVNDPEGYAKALKELGVDPKTLLHVRSFLDHNRPYRAPSGVVKAREAVSSGAYADDGRLVTNEELQQNFVEYLEAWQKHCIGDAGLLLLELHSIPPELAAERIGDTLATPYDATHGFSDQYTIEIPVFMAGAQEAGLELVIQVKLPNTPAATVSINYFKARQSPQAFQNGEVGELVSDRPSRTGLSPDLTPPGAKVMVSHPVRNQALEKEIMDRQVFELSTDAQGNIQASLVVHDSVPEADRARVIRDNAFFVQKINRDAAEKYRLARIELEKYLNERLMDTESSLARTCELLMSAGKVQSRESFRNLLLEKARQISLLIVKDGVLIHKYGPYLHSRRGESGRPAAVWIGQKSLEKMSQEMLTQSILDEALHAAFPNEDHYNPENQKGTLIHDETLYEAFNEILRSYNLDRALYHVTQLQYAALAFVNYSGEEYGALASKLGAILDQYPIDEFGSEDKNRLIKLRISFLEEAQAFIDDLPVKIDSDLEEIIDGLVNAMADLDLAWEEFSSKRFSSRHGDSKLLQPPSEFCQFDAMPVPVSPDLTRMGQTMSEITHADRNKKLEQEEILPGYVYEMSLTGTTVEAVPVVHDSRLETAQAQSSWAARMDFAQKLQKKNRSKFIQAKRGFEDYLNAQLADPSSSLSKTCQKLMEAGKVRDSEEFKVLLLSKAQAMHLLIVRDQVTVHQGGPYSHCRTGVSGRPAAVWIGQAALEKILPRTLMQIVLDESLHAAFPQEEHHDAQTGRGTIVHDDELFRSLDQILRSYNLDQMFYKVTQKEGAFLMMLQLFEQMSTGAQGVKKQKYQRHIQALKDLLAKHRSDRIDRDNRGVIRDYLKFRRKFFKRAQSLMGHFSESERTGPVYDSLNTTMSNLSKVMIDLDLAWQEWSSQQTMTKPQGSVLLNPPSEFCQYDATPPPMIWGNEGARIKDLFDRGQFAQVSSAASALMARARSLGLTVSEDVVNMAAIAGLEISYSQKNYQKVLDDGQKLIDAALQNDHPVPARLYYLRGSAAFEMAKALILKEGNQADARKYFQRAVEDLNQAFTVSGRDYDQRGKTQVSLVQVLFQFGEFEIGVGNYDLARPCFEGFLKHPEKAAIAASRVAKCNSFAGVYEKAEQFLGGSAGDSGEVLLAALDKIYVDVSGSEVNLYTQNRIWFYRWLIYLKISNAVEAEASFRKILEYSEAVIGASTYVLNDTVVKAIKGRPSLLKPYWKIALQVKGRPFASRLMVDFCRVEFDKMGIAEFRAAASEVLEIADAFSYVQWLLDLSVRPSSKSPKKVKAQAIEDIGLNAALIEAAQSLPSGDPQRAKIERIPEVAATGILIKAIQEEVLPIDEVIQQWKRVNASLEEFGNLNPENTPEYRQRMTVIALQFQGLWLSPMSLKTVGGFWERAAQWVSDELERTGSLDPEAERVLKIGIEWMSRFSGDAAYQDMCSRICCRLGSMYYHASRFKEAAVYLKMAVELGTVVAGLSNFLLGSCYYQQAKSTDQGAERVVLLRQAAAHIQRAISNKGVDPGTAYLMLSYVYFEQGEFQKALAAWVDASKNSSGLPQGVNLHQKKRNLLRNIQNILSRLGDLELGADLKPFRDFLMFICEDKEYGFFDLLLQIRLGENQKLVQLVLEMLKDPKVKIGVKKKLVVLIRGFDLEHKSAELLEILRGQSAIVLKNKESFLAEALDLLVTCPTDEAAAFLGEIRSDARYRSKEGFSDERLNQVAAAAGQYRSFAISDDAAEGSRFLITRSECSRALISYFPSLSDWDEYILEHETAKAASSLIGLSASRIREEIESARKSGIAKKELISQLKSLNETEGETVRNLEQLDAQMHLGQEWLEHRDFKQAVDLFYKAISGDSENGLLGYEAILERELDPQTGRRVLSQVTLAWSMVESVSHFLSYGYEKTLRQVEAWRGKREELRAKEPSFILEVAANAYYLGHVQEAKEILGLIPERYFTSNSLCAVWRLKLMYKTNDERFDSELERVKGIDAAVILELLAKFSRERGLLREALDYFPSAFFKADATGDSVTYRDSFLTYLDLLTGAGLRTVAADFAASNVTEYANADMILRAAEVLGNAGRYLEAVNILMRGRGKFAVPKDRGEYHRLRALLLLRLGKEAEAVEAYEEAIQADDSLIAGFDTSVLESVIENHIEKGDFQKAVFLFKKRRSAGLHVDAGILIRPLWAKMRAGDEHAGKHLANVIEVESAAGDFGEVKIEMGPDGPVLRLADFETLFSNAFGEERNFVLTPAQLRGRGLAEVENTVTEYAQGRLAAASDEAHSDVLRGFERVLAAGLIRNASPLVESLKARARAGDVQARRCLSDLARIEGVTGDFGEFKIETGPEGRVFHFAQAEKQFFDAFGERIDFVVPAHDFSTLSEGWIQEKVAKYVEEKWRAKGKSSNQAVGGFKKALKSGFVLNAGVLVQALWTKAAGGDTEAGKCLADIAEIEEAAGDFEVVRIERRGRDVLLHRKGLEDQFFEAFEERRDFIVTPADLRGRGISDAAAELAGYVETQLTGEDEAVRVRVLAGLKKALSAGLMKPDLLIQSLWVKVISGNTGARAVLSAVASVDGAEGDFGDVGIARRDGEKVLHDRVTERKFEEAFAGEHLDFALTPAQFRERGFGDVETQMARYVETQLTGEDEAGRARTLAGLKRALAEGLMKPDILVGSFWAKVVSGDAHARARLAEAASVEGVEGDFGDVSIAKRGGEKVLHDRVREKRFEEAFAGEHLDFAVAPAEFRERGFENIDANAAAIRYVETRLTAEDEAVRARTLAGLKRALDSGVVTDISVLVKSLWRKAVEGDDHARAQLCDVASVEGVEGDFEGFRIERRGEGKVFRFKEIEENFHLAFGEEQDLALSIAEFRESGFNAVQEKMARYAEERLARAGESHAAVTQHIKDALDLSVITNASLLVNLVWARVIKGEEPARAWLADLVELENLTWGSEEIGVEEGGKALRLKKVEAEFMRVFEKRKKTDFVITLEELRNSGLRTVQEKIAQYIETRLFEEGSDRPKLIAQFKEALRSGLVTDSGVLMRLLWARAMRGEIPARQCCLADLAQGGVTGDWGDASIEAGDEGPVLRLKAVEGRLAEMFETPVDMRVSAAEFRESGLSSVPGRIVGYVERCFSGSDDNVRRKASAGFKRALDEGLVRAGDTAFLVNSLYLKIIEGDAQSRAFLASLITDAGVRGDFERLEIKNSEAGIVVLRFKDLGSKYTEVWGPDTSVDFAMPLSEFQEAGLAGLQQRVARDVESRLLGTDAGQAAQRLEKLAVSRLIASPGDLIKPLWKKLINGDAQAGAALSEVASIAGVEGDFGELSIETRGGEKVLRLKNIESQFEKAFGEKLEFVVTISELRVSGLRAVYEKTVQHVKSQYPFLIELLGSDEIESAVHDAIEADPDGLLEFLISEAKWKLRKGESSYLPLDIIKEVLMLPKSKGKPLAFILGQLESRARFDQGGRKLYIGKSERTEGEVVVIQLPRRIDTASKLDGFLRDQGSRIEAFVRAYQAELPKERGVRVEVEPSNGSDHADQMADLLTRRMEAKMIEWGMMDVRAQENHGDRPSEKGANGEKGTNGEANGAVVHTETATAGQGPVAETGAEVLGEDDDAGRGFSNLKDEAYERPIQSGLENGRALGMTSDQGTLTEKQIVKDGGGFFPSSASASDEERGNLTRALAALSPADQAHFEGRTEGLGGPVSFIFVDGLDEAVKRELEAKALTVPADCYGSHYGLLRPQIYMDRKWLKDPQELRRQLHHELAEREAVIRALNAKFPNWRRQERTDDIEKMIAQTAGSAHRALLLEEGRWANSLVDEMMARLDQSNNILWSFLKNDAKAREIMRGRLRRLWVDHPAIDLIKRELQSVGVSPLSMILRGSYLWRGEGEKPGDVDIIVVAEGNARGHQNFYLSEAGFEVDCAIVGSQALQVHQDKQRALTSRLNLEGLLIDGSGIDMGYAVGLKDLLQHAKGLIADSELQSESDLGKQGRRLFMAYALLHSYMGEEARRAVSDWFFQGLSFSEYFPRFFKGEAKAPWDVKVKGREDSFIGVTRILQTEIERLSQESAQKNGENLHPFVQAVLDHGVYRAVELDREKIDVGRPFSHYLPQFTAHDEAALFGYFLNIKPDAHGRYIAQDHYEFQELIGAGSYGLVFRMRDVQTGQTLALRVSYTGMMRNNTWVRALLNYRVDEEGYPAVLQMGQVKGSDGEHRLYVLSEYFPRQENVFKSTLAETFGAGAVHSVFDSGTGRGDWMQAIQGKPWLASDARVVGHDLPVPMQYAGDGGDSITQNWPSLRIVHSYDDQDYPGPGTVDLLHESYMEMGLSDNEGRFQNYDRLLREGGWIVFAHHCSMVDPRKFTDWLDKLGYPCKVYDGNDVPADYPTTFWWQRLEMEQAMGLGAPLPPRTGHYLIVARKISYVQPIVERVIGSLGDVSKLGDPDLVERISSVLMRFYPYLDADSYDDVCTSVIAKIISRVKTTRAPRLFPDRFSAELRRLGLDESFIEILERTTGTRTFFEVMGEMAEALGWYEDPQTQALLLDIYVRAFLRSKKIQTQLEPLRDAIDVSLQGQVQGGLRGADVENIVIDFVKERFLRGEKGTEVEDSDIEGFFESQNLDNLLLQKCPLAERSGRLKEILVRFMQGIPDGDLSLGMLLERQLVRRLPAPSSLKITPMAERTSIENAA